MGRIGSGVWVIASFQIGYSVFTFRGAMVKLLFWFRVRISVMG